MLKRILIGLAAVFLVIQFIRPQKNLSTAPQPEDIVSKFPTPPEVKRSLQAACYDCHSNNTRYPWYAKVQPAAWFIAHHVEDGKEHLNFSEFGALAPKRATRRLQQAIDEMEDGGMPLKSYTLIHGEARLSEAQIKQIKEWAERILRSYPADTSH
jgi:hypothetical protein